MTKENGPFKRKGQEGWRPKRAVLVGKEVEPTASVDPFKSLKHLNSIATSFENDCKANGSNPRNKRTWK